MFTLLGILLGFHIAQTVGQRFSLRFQSGKLRLVLLVLLRVFLSQVSQSSKAIEKRHRVPLAGVSQQRSIPFALVVIVQALI